MQPRNTTIGVVFYGDPDRYPGIVNSCAVMAEAGYDVHIVCLKLLHQGYTYPEEVRVTRVHDGKGSPLRRSLNHARFLRALRRISRRENWRACFAHDLHALVAVTLVVPKLLARTIFWVQDIHHPTEGGWLLKMLHNLVRRSVHKCRLVITPSKTRAKAVQRLYGICYRPFVVYNSPRKAPLTRSSYIRRRYNLSERHTVVLYQGAISPARSICEIIRSMRFLPEDCVLVIGGFYAAGFEPVVRSCIADCRLQKRVFLAGETSLEGVAEWVGSADVGIALHKLIDYSTRNLGVASNKIFEYISGGAAILASAQEEASQVIEGGGAGICVDANNESAIQEALTRIVESPQRLRTMQINSRRLFEREYYFEKHFGVVLKVVRSLCN